MNELIVPKPPRSKARALITAGVIFASVFVIVLVLFNLPAATSAVTYTATHSQEKDAQQLTDQYRSLYGYDAHPELSYVATQPTVAPSTAPAANNQNQDIQISIPKLNITAPVLQVPSATDEDILAALKNGVVLFPGSAMPGQGQAVIVGHSSSLPPWTKYSAIFAQLGSLAPDDLIHLTSQGHEYIYRVSAVRRGSVQDILNSGMTGDLILSTCWPVGTDTNRVAVSAVRIQ